jgi:hypothetical protein
VEARRAQLEADLARAVQEKQQALAADNNQFQQQTLEQYRLPLLNLKLKIDNVQTSRADVEKLNEQMQALTKERDDKINAHNAANQQALAAFQKAQIQAANDQMQAYEQQLRAEGQQAVNARAAALTDQLRAQLKTTQAAFDQRLREQQAQIIAQARQQEAQQIEKFKAQAQTQAAQQYRAENSRLDRLQQQLRSVEVSRAQLLAVITADIRVEAAALAQEKRWDAVLTQAVAAPGAADATDELIARLKH